MSSNQQGRTEYLMHLEKEYLTFQQCKNAIKNVKVKENMLCAQNSDKKKSACYGDSGAPLYDAVEKKLAGVVSSGPDDCAGAPTIYSRIASDVSVILALLIFSFRFHSSDFALSHTRFSMHGSRIQFARTAIPSLNFVWTYLILPFHLHCRIRHHHEVNTFRLYHSTTTVTNGV